MNSIIKPALAEQATPIVTALEKTALFGSAQTALS